MSLCCKVRKTDIIWVKCQPWGKTHRKNMQPMSTRLDMAEAASLVSSITLHENGNEDQVYQ